MRFSGFCRQADGKVVEDFVNFDPPKTFKTEEDCVEAGKNQDDFVKAVEYKETGGICRYVTADSVTVGYGAKVDEQDETKEACFIIQEEG